MVKVTITAVRGPAPRDASAGYLLFRDVALIAAAATGSATLIALLVGVDLPFIGIAGRHRGRGHVLLLRTEVCVCVSCV